MSLFCRLRTHATGTSMVENQGFAFCRCHRCGNDLVRSLSSSSTRWHDVPVGFRVLWGDVDLAIFDPPAVSTHVMESVRHAGRSAVARVGRLGRVAQVTGRSAVSGSAGVIRGSSVAALDASRMLVAAVAMLAWKIADTSRLVSGKLRNKAVAAGRVIRLGEARGRAQQWNLVIHLNVQPHLDGLGGTAWIDKPVKI